MEHKSKQVAEIQGLRGVAIIGVLLFHLWDKAFPVGYLGVDIFFVISGYLMCRLLSRHSLLTAAHVADFYFRRIKRIVPVYLFAVWLVLMAAAFRFVFPIDYANLLAETWKPLLFAANVPDSSEADYFVQSMGAYRFFRHLWSLSVEIQFYLCVPLLMFGLSFFTRTMKTAVVSLLAVASFWLQGNSEANDEHMSLDSRVWQFMCGFLAFFLQQELKRREGDAPKSSAIATRFLQVFLSALVLAGVSFDLTGTKQHNRLLLLAAVVLLLARPTGNPLLSQRLLVWVGDVSYSVYLLHWPLFEWHRYWDVGMYAFQGNTTLLAGCCLIAASLLAGWAVESGWQRVSAWISSWFRLLAVVGGGYAAIGLTCSFLMQTAVTQNFSLDRSVQLENAAELAAETIRLWEERNATPPFRSPLEIIDENNRFQYLTWNLVTCKHPQKELLPTRVNLTSTKILWACTEDEGTGDKNILVIGNSHARSYYFGLEYAFRGVYRHLSMFGTNCPFLMLEAERDFGEGYKNSFHRCSTFLKAMHKIVRKWKHPLDVIIVGINYHRFVNYRPPANGTLDTALQEMNALFGRLAAVAREVVFVPLPQFQTGHAVHTPTLQRKILYGGSLDAFRSTVQQQRSLFPHARRRLESLECAKCVLVDWLDVWCERRAAVCDSVDQRRKFSFFFDSHHVNALGSLKAGAHVRSLYDRWLQQRTARSTR